jgi:ferredoxin-NADP reductase
VSVVLRPGWDWPGHEAGQYVRVGLSVDGVQHWRAYSISSPPERADGRITITPKLVAAGRVTPQLVRRARRGDVVRLGGVEGTFVLPRPLPERLLFVTAGSGVTPVMSMLRSLEARGTWPDVVHLHCARHAGDVVFGPELRALAARRPALRLHERHTRDAGRLTPGELTRLVPDWRERAAFVSGPAGLLEALGGLWAREGDPARLRIERFAPAPLAAPAAPGTGGSVRFCASGVEAQSDGVTSLLEAGERAGLALRHGCRMGICHSCVAPLRAGRVRDLRTGRVAGEPGERVRLCVSAPEGPVELDA